jgi:hypothetical protein
MPLPWVANKGQIVQIVLTTVGVALGIVSFVRSLGKLTSSSMLHVSNISGVLSLSCFVAVGIIWLARRRTSVPPDVPSLQYEGTRRRKIILGCCYSAIFVGIVNELKPRKQLSTAQNIRANIIYRDHEGKEIARMFRALWWIDICHANDRASIRPGDKAEVALAWDMGIDGFSPQTPDVRRMLLNRPDLVAG